MKKLISLISLAALCFTASAQIQTNSPQGTFFGSVSTYFSSFDTNSTTFLDNKGEVWTGGDYVSGVNIASSLGVSYHLTTSGLSLESVTRNAGIAGTILNQQIGLGYSKVVYDAKITGYVAGGYDFNLNKPYVAIGARAMKALTSHTFGYVGLESQIFGKRPATPIFSMGVGFTF